MNIKYSIYLIIGFILGSLLLLYSIRFRPNSEKRTLAISLVAAAVIYIALALIWGNIKWVFIETAGLAVYGIFVWASIRHSGYWLALGWLLHPIWDIILHLLGPGRIVAPEWYVIACVPFDFLIAGYILFRIKDWKRL